MAAGTVHTAADHTVYMKNDEQMEEGRKHNNTKQVEPSEGPHSQISTIHYRPTL